MGVVNVVLISLIIAGAFIGIFYKLGRNHWAPTEYYWEGSFALLASIITTVMGAALLRVSKMQENWRVKLAKAIEAKVVIGDSSGGDSSNSVRSMLCSSFPWLQFSAKALRLLSFIDGVSLQGSLLVVLMAILSTRESILETPVWWLLTSVRGSASAMLQYFFVISTSLLYLIGAGLFSKAVWYFEAQKWNNEVGGDAEEVGVGAGSYDITKSVRHVNVSASSSPQ
jgi:high-affinity iron transporter